ncbi:MAG: hypothetical protein J6Y11_11125 [Paludibacteraceae bacterium]|nr:hypothetical protein [Paludibacteraceae bacterium]
MLQKISLSRKGFDSGYGRIPSPILPDGTLLTMPIPDSGAIQNSYESLVYQGKSYYDIIKELSPNTKIKPQDNCHLDPDLFSNCKSRELGWKPSFGQTGAALSHLNKQGFGLEDLFLFFGWFRETESFNGQLRYRKNAPDIHIIFGYMQVGEMIESNEDVPSWLKNHPHADDNHWKKKNCIYTPTQNLTFMNETPGAGLLKFDPKRILTKTGCSRTIWDLPDFFKEIEITYHSQNSWQAKGFKSACKGQEFVFCPDDKAMEWIKDILK